MKTKGGARKGAGGKRPASDPTIQATVTISASQRAKLRALGGSKFIQSALDEAIISPALQAQLDSLKAKEQK